MKLEPAKRAVIFKYLFWIWLILILTISSIPNLPGPELKTDNTVLRLDYMIHAIEYFVLVTFFLFWQLGKGLQSNILFILLTLLGGLLIATADEYHQIWIPGRTFNPMDMYANYAGLLAGILFSSIILAKSLYRERGSG